MQTLILLGKGESKKRLNEYLTAYPEADLWTLNDYPHAGSSRHFDIHYDQRHWDEFEKVRCSCVVSPFIERSGFEQFPLDAIHSRFGCAYLESTIDFMAAFAALVGQYERLVLCGVDMQDNMHFAYRPGLHFWLGVLSGQGVEIVRPEESACLVRYPERAAIQTEINFPHIYGQPRHVTDPVRRRYGWRRI